MRRALRRIAVSVTLVLLTGGAAWAQKLGQAPDDGVSLVRVFGALVICLAIAVAAAFFLRNRAGLSQLLPLVRQSSRLRLVESVRLGPQVSLCIVRCDGQDLLLEVSPQGAGVLRTLPITAEPDRPA
jgi:flagellar biogenesis protein FliO